jgi:excisionase family DNA binding protein
MTDTTIKYLTADELAAQSRFSSSTIHRLKKAGKIPFIQPAGKGGRLLFPADALERTAEPAAPIGQPESVRSELSKRLSGRQPKWKQPPTPNNHE